VRPALVDDDSPRLGVGIPASAHLVIFNLAVRTGLVLVFPPSAHLLIYSWVSLGSVFVFSASAYAATVAAAL
jgi:hypothetical protein